MNALKTLSVQQAVTATGMSDELIYRLIRLGKVNANRVGRVWRIQEVSLVQWIEQSQGRQMTATSPEAEKFGLSEDEQVFS